MTAPNFETNAPQGWCGDWKRGAPMGRPTIGPDPRTMDELQADFVTACQRQDLALRLKEKSPADGWKAHCWEAAARHYADERAEIRELVKALEARKAESPKITLQRVRLDSGGYDSAGAYWGHGEPLFWAADDSGAYDSTFRADDRDDAKAIVRRTYPGARFFR